MGQLRLDQVFEGLLRWGNVYSSHLPNQDGDGALAKPNWTIIESWSKKLSWATIRPALSKWRIWTPRVENRRPLAGMGPRGPSFIPVISRMLTTTSPASITSTTLTFESDEAAIQSCIQAFTSSFD